MKTMSSLTLGALALGSLALGIDNAAAQYLPQVPARLTFALAGNMQNPATGADANGNYRNTTARTKLITTNLLSLVSRV
jgi:hypothetical protein